MKNRGARSASSEAEKNAAGAVHPQFAMHALLDRIGIARDIVKQLADPATHGREMLVSEALRPAATTDRWQRHLGSADFAAATDRAMAGVQRDRSRQCRG